MTLPSIPSFIQHFFSFLRPTSRTLLLVSSAIFFLSFGLTMNGQQRIIYDSVYLASVQDTLDRYYRRHPWKLPSPKKPFTVIPHYGINYSQESSFGVSGGFVGLYKSSTDTLVPYSAVSAIANASVNLSIQGAIKGSHYAPKGRFLFNYSIRYGYLPRYFWGIGYDYADDNSNKGTFTEQSATFRTEILYRDGNRLLAGPILGFDYLYGSKFSHPELVEGQPCTTKSTKFGLTARYDTRDDISSPQEGIYLEAEHVFYFGMFDIAPFYRTTIITDFFFPTWEGCVFAVDLFGDFSYGDSPWMTWPEMGGGNRMRGYYEGRYRDKNLISAQLEIRQDIWKGHGAAVWGGVGNLFHDAASFDVTHSLPTWGIGYRYKFFGLLLRIDVGFGKAGQYALSAGINQAF